jgi:hypothetical protein
VTTGLGPHGEVVTYYNFEVQSTTPAPICVLFRKGDDKPVAGQLNIVDVIPGDTGYNDFWQVTKTSPSSMSFSASLAGSLPYCDLHAFLTTDESGHCSVTVPEKAEQLSGQHSTRASLRSWPEGCHSVPSPR